MKPTPKYNGFSSLDLLLIIAALAGIVLVILPQFARSRARTKKIGCTNCLKQVSYAFRIWAGDCNDKLPTQVSVTNGGVMEFALRGSAYEVFLVMSNELSTPKILICPDESNPKRLAATVFGAVIPVNSPAGSVAFTPSNNLSYFVGLDADLALPQTVLAGDDHFSLNGSSPKPGLFPLPTNAPVVWRNERHRYGGNIGFADGSVQGFSSAALRTALANTGFATNRLAMP